MEEFRIAVVQLCVDDRLDHPRLRPQIAEKLRALYLTADHIFLVNEIAGNFGENFRNTIGVFQESGAQIVFCGLLHHDDCRAAAAGKRLPLEQSVGAMSDFLARRGITCPVYTGCIHTESNEIAW